MLDEETRTAIAARFPEGSVLQLEYGVTLTPPPPGEAADEPRLELMLIPRGPEQYNAEAIKPRGTKKSGSIPEEVYGAVVHDFREQHAAVLDRLARDLPNLLPDCELLGVRYGGYSHDWTFPPAPEKRGLTSVMVRLDRADLETLDTLIAAGFANSRAEAVRWSLGRIRERPVYQQLRQRVTELAALREQF